MTTFYGLPVVYLKVKHTHLYINGLLRLATVPEFGEQTVINHANQKCLEHKKESQRACSNTGSRNDSRNFVLKKNTSRHNRRRCRRGAASSIENVPVGVFEHSGHFVQTGQNRCPSSEEEPLTTRNCIMQKKVCAQSTKKHCWSRHTSFAP